MKLFFDENLSSRLVHSLAALYPGSEHVQDRRLDAADDASIWDFARANGFTIASKDSDFYDPQRLAGQSAEGDLVESGQLLDRCD